MISRPAFSVLLGLLALTASCAQPPARPDGSVTVENAWIAAPLGATDSVSGFATIHNTGPADRLVSASSPRAADVMLHEMSMEGAVMTMRMLEGGLPTPTGVDTMLSPNGAHLMLMGVTGPLAVGDKVPVVMQFEQAGAVSVDFTVSSQAPAPAAHDMPH